MNSAPSRIKSAATETSVEIKKSAECTALRARIVNSAATSAATANTQKKTAAQPDKIIADFGMRIADLPIGLPSIRNPKSACRNCFRRSEEHTSELQSLAYLVCRLL